MHRFHCPFYIEFPKSQLNHIPKIKSIHYSVSDREERKSLRRARANVEEPAATTNKKRKKENNDASVITDISSVTHTIHASKSPISKAKAQKGSDDLTVGSVRSTRSKTSIKEKDLLPPEKIISTMQAWRILQRKLSFRTSDNMYILPNVKKTDIEVNKNAFQSQQTLRTYLLKHRIPADPMKLTEEEKIDLSRWLAYTHVPTNAPAMEALSDSRAWNLLIQRGFKFAGGAYLLPGFKLPLSEAGRFATEGKEWFSKVSSIQEWCCRNGVPGPHDEVRTQLSLWSSSCILEIL